MIYFDSLLSKTNYTITIQNYFQKELINTLKNKPKWNRLFKKNPKKAFRYLILAIIYSSYKNILNGEKELKKKISKRRNWNSAWKINFYRLAIFYSIELTRLYNILYIQKNKDLKKDIEKNIKKLSNNDFNIFISSLFENNSFLKNVKKRIINNKLENYRVPNSFIGIANNSATYLPYFGDKERIRLLKQFTFDKINAQLAEKEIYYDVFSSLDKKLWEFYGYPKSFSKNETLYSNGDEFYTSGISSKYLFNANNGIITIYVLLRIKNGKAYFGFGRNIIEKNIIKGIKPVVGFAVNGKQKNIQIIYKNIINKSINSRIDSQNPYITLKLELTKQRIIWSYTTIDNIQSYFINKQKKIRNLNEDLDDDLNINTKSRMLYDLDENTQIITNNKYNDDKYINYEGITFKTLYFMNSDIMNEIQSESIILSATSNTLWNHLCIIQNNEDESW